MTGIYAQGRYPSISKWRSMMRKIDNKAAAEKTAANKSAAKAEKG